jgi:hypothetical protein
MTKAESAEVDSMWEEINKSLKTLGQKVWCYLLNSVKTRQVGAIEAADRLLGNKLYSFSRQFRFVDLSKLKELKRTLKLYKEIQELAEKDPRSSDLFVIHWVSDVYPNRPDHMKIISLYELLAWNECEKQGKDEVMKMKNGSFYLRKRTQRPYIIKHKKVNPMKSDTKKEDYYSILLKLFKPWRKESDIIIKGLNSFQTYCIESENYPAIVTIMKNWLQNRKWTQNMKKSVKKSQRDSSK